VGGGNDRTPVLFAGTGQSEARPTARPSGNRAGARSKAQQGPAESGGDRAGPVDRNPRSYDPDSGDARVGVLRQASGDGCCPFHLFGSRCCLFGSSGRLGWTIWRRWVYREAGSASSRCSKLTRGRTGDGAGKSDRSEADVPRTSGSHV